LNKDQPNEKSSLFILKELKYDFNEKSELRHTETQRPFVFNYYENVLEKNSKRYQALGHLLEQYVYELLEKVCKLQKVYIPPEADKEARSFFFMSERALTNHHSALLVLLQDHGVFRAGQWSQQAIIHHGLQHGSQIPCIQMWGFCTRGEILGSAPNTARTSDRR
uniref:Arb2 domain-containing protein n=1 Tax=Catagonus wagneri TaxID=51154 RepID=A0A8C3WFI4_9CETA